jgi:hypothetical protein
MVLEVRTGVFMNTFKNICKICKEPFESPKHQVSCDDCKVDCVIERKVKTIINDDIEWWRNNSKGPEPVDDESNLNLYDQGE